MNRLIRILKKYYCYILGYTRRSIEYLMALVFFPFPVQKKVVFISYGGKGYGCNPKYIAEEMLVQKTGYELIWLVHNMELPFPDGIQKVRFHSWKAIYALATAKVIVTNTKVDMRILKKKEQYVIQTWHSAYRNKLSEGMARDKLPTRYIRESKRNSRQTDLFLSNSKVLSQEYRDAFWCECEILECGLPRMDVMFHWDRGIPLRVKEKLGISQSAKVILYAPTFRDNGTETAYNLDFQGVLDSVGQDGQEWYLLVRMHPNVRYLQKNFIYSPHILNATDYPDMQELLLTADILITDYSSTIYDFAVLKKPAYLYAPDVEEYHKMRGLKEQFFHLPFPLCRTNQELQTQLSQYNAEKGSQLAQTFLDYYGSVDKGDASKQVVQRICMVMERKYANEHEEYENEKGIICGNRGEDPHHGISYSLSEDVSGAGVGDGGSCPE